MPNAGDVPNENVMKPEVYFCPKDDCGKVFENQINLANSSVHCALYSINLRNIINSMAKKSRNVDVRVVMDNTNYKGQIKGNGIRVDNDNQLMHNKFCVIDSKAVITGSFNPAEADNLYDNNNVVVVYSKYLAQNYEDEFAELWAGKFGQGGKVIYPLIKINNMTVENYFCPEDRCALHLLGLINNANKSVYFLSFSFTKADIADALIKAKRLEIKGVFDAHQSTSKFSQYSRLKEFGIDARKSTNKHLMHNKVFIIDNSTVVTGSFNPTANGDKRNDENLLVIHDKGIASAYVNEFESLWAKSK